jgi:hypothetical protein
MKTYLIFILLFFLGFNNLKAQVVTRDSSKVDIRTFDENKIKKWRESSRYDYKTKQSWLNAAWNRFWEWIASLLGKKTKNAAENAGGGELMNALIAVGAIILLIFGLSKVKFRTWISRKGAVVEQEYEVEEENIHEIEFDKDIKDAELDGDYRRAIRLLFLKVLKNLTDAEFIYWDPNKTNHQYLYELKGTNLYTPFVGCVNVFDRVWYGEWEIDKMYYMANKGLFEDLAKNSLKIKTAVFNG